MKRMALLALFVAVIGSSTGCCLLDRIFCCPRTYPLVGGGCCRSGCGLGRCQHANCGPGGCMADGPADGVARCQGCGAALTGGATCPTCGYGMVDPAEEMMYAKYRRQQCPPGGGYGGGGYGGRYGAGGPPTGAVTYPYYTTRGPRDFLARNPRSIGP